VIFVMTHGPGTLTGRVPVTVSTFPPGSVTVRVLAFTGVPFGSAYTAGTRSAVTAGG
jgi:hypothetical protein